MCRDNLFLDILLIIINITIILLSCLNHFITILPWYYLYVFHLLNISTLLYQGNVWRNHFLLYFSGLYELVLVTILHNATAFIWNIYHQILKMDTDLVPGLIDIMHDDHFLSEIIYIARSLLLNMLVHQIQSYNTSPKNLILSL